MSVIVTATTTTTTTPTSSGVATSNENLSSSTSMSATSSSSSVSSTSSSPFLKATDSTDSLDSQSSVSTIKLSPSPSLAIYKPLPKQFQHNAITNSHQQIHHSLEVPKIVPPLVRKKSGELVKSSLKLPSLLPKALSTSQLNRSKSVRFASRLTNIKMFDGMESPSTVSTSDNTPIHSPQYMDEFDDLQDEYTLQSTLPPLSMRGSNNSNHRGGHRHKRSDYFQWYSNDLASDTSSDEDDWSIHPTTVPRSNSTSAVSIPSHQNHSNHSGKKEYKIIYNNLPSIHPYNQSVYVASISLIKEFGKSFLFGLINVENLGFEKNLMIKLSMDNWVSNIIFNNGLTTSYNKSINSNTDQFKFKILLDDLIGDDHSQTTVDSNGNVNIQMCIKYTVNHHQVYWDNNDGANYQIHLAPVLSGIQSYTYKPSTPIQKAQHQQQVQKQEYKELVLKLKAIEFDPEVSKLQQQPMADFSLKYNFTDHDSNVRPSLKHSYSASDIPQSRYSQAFKSKQQSNFSSTAATTARPLSTDFSSLSYTDIINKFCFSNGDSTINSTTSNSVTNTPPITTSIPFHQPLPIKISPPNESTTSLNCSPSPASAFHSFSDSIHI